MNHLVSFLQFLKEFPRFYWKGRGSNRAYIGYGHNPSAVFTFRAQAFHPEGCEGIWSDFPQEWSLSPEHLITADWSYESATPIKLPRCIGKQDTPTYEKWWHLVRDACKKIDQNLFQKIVLARQTTLTFEDTVNPLELLKGLMSFGNEASIFMVQLDPKATFLGASPEKLYKRIDRTILTEALAGTITKTEKWSPKEFREVETVRFFLKNQLDHCCKDTQSGSLEERPFGNLRHLYQKLNGLLKNKISDSTLISKLHPTPALGGYPREITMNYLRSAESFCRGWYGAPIGLISEKETDLAIAIRSMLVIKNQIHIFAGAGIVKGSDPAKEWKELDRKISHVLGWCDE